MLHRVETGFPVYNTKMAQRTLRDLELYLEDNTQAWELLDDGSYQRQKPKEEEEPTSAQLTLLERLAN